MSKNKRQNRNDAETATMVPKEEERDLLSSSGESSGNPEAETPPEPTPDAAVGPSSPPEAPELPKVPEQTAPPAPPVEPTPPEQFKQPEHPYLSRVTDAGLVPVHLRGEDGKPCVKKVDAHLAACWRDEKLPNIPGVLVWT